MQYLRLFAPLFAAVATLGAPGASLSREVYVWQRQPSQEVWAAADAIRDDVEGFAFLGAEISWRGNQPEVFEVPFDAPALMRLQRPIALVVRVGPYGGPFARDDSAVRYLLEVVTRMLATARAAGLEPAELQLDFDCATSKLAGYREWLVALRSATRLKVTFTALPDWLRSPDFAKLARNADGYVLQVHSLEKPRNVREDFTLCDPARVWPWVEAANEVGVPFKVALPTYGYRLGFDQHGTFLGLAAEGASVDWSAGKQVRTVRSDPVALAALAAKLAYDAPAHCVGVIWFRLPVASDRLNWPLVTLRSLLRGGIPRAQLDGEISWPEPGLVELSVVNHGERDEVLPRTVQVAWGGPEVPKSYDGVGGYQATQADVRAGAVAWRVSAAAAERILSPGSRRKIGWMRFSHELPLTLTLAATP